MLRAFAFAGLLLAGASAASAQAPPDTTLLSAERAARAWLSRLDAAEYDTAWTAVAGAMRASTTYQEWATSLSALRAALPAAPVRTLLRAEHSVPLFGGPSVLMTFSTGRAGLREIIVLVREGARWRIGGYGVLL